MKNSFHNLYKEFEKKLGYSFQDSKLLETALMHRSFRFEKTGIKDDNQRLEFLGDAVLGLVATDYVFHTFEYLQEGDLTSLRSRFTSGKALAEIGRAADIGEYLKLGKGERQSGGVQRPSNITDAMEAVLGAVYLDGGVKAVKKIFEKLFIPMIKISPADTWSDNPKGQLQEINQKKWKTNPVYQLISQRGPAHAKVFIVKVFVNKIIAGQGKGLSKQQAEQEAAKNAIEFLRQQETHPGNDI